MQHNHDTVSMIVFGYNQEKIIGDAISGALNQTFSPLEIVLSDNGSSDATFDIMRKAAEHYGGPHRIKLNRNSKNRGFIGHVNQVFDITSSEFVVYNPGDDVSEPERVAKLYQRYRETNALLVHSEVKYMDAEGKLTGEISSQIELLKDLTLNQAATETALCIGATCGWDRGLQALFGPIVEEDTYDDLIYYFRAMLADRVAEVPEPLVRYRLGLGFTNTKAETPIDKLRLKEQKLSVRLGTFRQRLADCKKFSPEQRTLIEILKKLVDESEFRHAIWNRSPGVYKEAALSFRKLNILRSELKKRNRAHSKAAKSKERGT